MNDPTAVRVAPRSFEIAPADRSRLACATTLTRHKLDCDRRGRALCTRAEGGRVAGSLDAVHVPGHDGLNRTGFPESSLRDSGRYDWSLLTAIVLLFALDRRGKAGRGKEPAAVECAPTDGRLNTSMLSTGSARWAPTVPRGAALGSTGRHVSLATNSSVSTSMSHDSRYNHGDVWAVTAARRELTPDTRPLCG